MSRLIDITGNKYGMLTVIEYLGKCKWRCKCDCGNEIIADGNNLRRLHTKSCGCLLLNDKIAVGSMYKGAMIIGRHSDIFVLECNCGAKFNTSHSNLNAAKVLTCPTCSRKRTTESVKSKIRTGNINHVVKPIYLKLRIAEIRKEKGITQKELASAIGTVRSKISDIERGAIKGENLTLGNAVKIAKFLRVSIEELFEIGGD